MTNVSPMEDANPKPVDTRYQVAVAADSLTAWLTVIPPENGGAAPDPAAARAALANAGVIFGIDEPAIANALGPALGSQTEVAHGTPPQPGKDGWLEPLVAVNQQRLAHADAQGRVDFRDRGTTPSVAPNDALMRRHPPIPGVSGQGVTGKVLPVAAAKAAKFSVRLQGVEVAPDDTDLLRAAVAGQPILVNDGITVEPILRLDTVDMASGNVEFIGSVEAAELIAGGDIVVKGGVIGHSPQEGKDIQQMDTARLTAKGSIKARYLENCIVLAEQAVEIDEAVIQCDVTAIEQVCVGSEGTGKGSIVGGTVRATARVRANVLGGPGSSQTRILVGVNPLLQRAIEECREHIDAKLKESGELTKVLKLLATRPDKAEIAAKARLTLQKVNEEIAEALNEEKILKARLQVADQARIVVSGRVYSGVTATIGKKSRFAPEDTGPGVFVIANDTLIYGDLAAYGG